jgi:tetratricopeptide (TPR) repeat protein
MFPKHWPMPEKIADWKANCTLPSSPAAAQESDVAEARKKTGGCGGIHHSAINPRYRGPYRSLSMTKKNLPAPAKKTAPPAPSKVAAKSAVPPPPARKTVVVEGPSAAELQLKSYEHAVRLFAQRRLDEARDRFLESAKGPAAHISDKARSYIQVCERRTAGVESRNLSAEDHFNHGVERLNARDVEQARVHFGRALTQQPDADHILYTMALCCGLSGDGNGACENLKRAIHLEPRNRILARQDPEFLALASQFPALRSLLEPSF